MTGSSVTSAVSAGLQVLGTTLDDRNGRTHDGLGLPDLTTVPGRSRAVGELASDCDIPGVGNGTRYPAVDGAVHGRVVATYVHGPTLARNPALADHLLRPATGLPFHDTESDRPDSAAAAERPGRR